MPLSAEQMQKVERLKNHIDPLQRLTSDFYTLQRKVVVADYEKLMGAATDQDERDCARDMFTTNLEKLQQDIISDVKLHFTLLLGKYDLPVAPSAILV